MKTIGLLLGCIFCLSTSQKTSAQMSPSNGGNAASSPSMNIRFVALGDQAPVRMGKSDQDIVIDIPSVVGAPAQKRTIPKGSIIELPPKDFECIPANLFFQGEAVPKPQEAQAQVGVPLTLNSVTQELKIKPMATLQFKRQVGLTEDSAPILQPYCQPQSLPQTQNLLVTVIGNPKEELRWKDPMIRVMDSSPAAMPAGSLVFFNGTPFPVELQLPVQGKRAEIIVPPYQKHVVRPDINVSGRTKAIAKLVPRNAGEKSQFYYNTVPVPANGRSFLFAYFDPKPQATIPAGMVQFSDTLTP